MRTYSIFTPQRWIGATGRKLRRGIQERAKGDPVREAYKDAQIVADMLVNNPSATMYGLYYITKAQMADLTGLDAGEITEALAILNREEFARYDETSEFVWVKEMARVQMFLPLKPGDRNVKPAQRWYASLPRNPFLPAFYDRYSQDLHLEARRDEWREERLPLQPSAAEEPSGPSLVELWFLTFLESYPAARRVGGAAGEAAFQKAMRGRDESHLIAMCEALHYQKRSEQWRRGVIPSMVKWLDEQQWTRDLPGKSINDFECEHGTCRSAGAHTLRVELEKVCRHGPPCESFVDHYNRGGDAHEDR